LRTSSPLTRELRCRWTAPSRHFPYDSCLPLAFQLRQRDEWADTHCRCQTQLRPRPDLCVTRATGPPQAASMTQCSSLTRWRRRHQQPQRTARSLWYQWQKARPAPPWRQSAGAATEDRMDFHDCYELPPRRCAHTRHRCAQFGTVQMVWAPSGPSYSPPSG